MNTIEVLGYWLVMFAAGTFVGGFLTWTALNLWELWVNRRRRHNR